jgi:hypothetical protein
VFLKYNNGPKGVGVGGRERDNMTLPLDVLTYVLLDITVGRILHTF